MNKALVIGGVLAVGVAGGAYYGLPIFFHNQVQGNLDGVSAALPEGAEFSYSGLETDFWKREITLSKLDFSWPELENLKGTGLGKGGSIALKDIHLQDPEIFSSFAAGSGSQTLFGSLTLGSSKLQLTHNELTANWDASEFQSLALDFDQIGNGSFTPNSISLKDFNLNNLVFSQNFDHILEGKTQTFLINGKTEKITISDVQSGKIGSVVSNGSSYEVLFDVANGDHMEMTGTIGSTEVKGLHIAETSSQELAPLSDTASKWVGQEELHATLEQLVVELRKANNGWGRYDSANISDLKGLVKSKNGPAEGIPYSMASMEAKDVTPTTQGSTEIRDLSVGLPDVGLTVGFIRGKDLDMSGIEPYLVKILDTGYEPLVASFAQDDWEQFLPEFKMGEMAYGNIEIDSQQFSKFKLGEVRFFDLAIDKEKAMSFGYEMKDLQLPLAPMQLFEPQAIGQLMEMGHENLTISSKIDLDHSPNGKTFSVNAIELSAKELGDIAINAAFDNFAIPAPAGKNPTEGLFSNLASLKLMIQDRDLVKFGLTSFANQNQIPLEQATEQVKFIVGMLGAQGKSPQAVELFTAVTQFLDGSKKLEIVSAPEQPIPLMQVMAAGQQPGPDALVQLLDLKSSIK